MLEWPPATSASTSVSRPVSPASAVGVHVRWHADVDDGQVRSPGTHLREQRDPVADRPDDLAAEVTEEADEPFSEENRVLRHEDASQDRPDGRALSGGAVDVEPPAERVDPVPERGQPER